VSLLFSTGQTAIKLSGTEAADRAQCAGTSVSSGGNRQRPDLHQTSCEAAFHRRTSHNELCLCLLIGTAESSPSAHLGPAALHRNCHHVPQCCTLYKQPGHNTLHFNVQHQLTISTDKHVSCDRHREREKFSKRLEWIRSIAIFHYLSIPYYLSTTGTLKCWLKTYLTVQSYTINSAHLVTTSASNL